MFDYVIALNSARIHDHETINTIYLLAQEQNRKLSFVRVCRMQHVLDELLRMSLCRLLCMGHNNYFCMPTSSSSISNLFSNSECHGRKGTKSKRTHTAHGKLIIIHDETHRKDVHLE